MSVKEDLRVKRTKKALYESFIKLLCAKPFDEITVNELCDVAGIRRATFYKHYADKFDFLAAYTRLLRDSFDKEVSKSGRLTLTKDYYVSYARRVIHFIDEHSVAVDNICKSSLFPSVLAIIFEQNFKDTKERLRLSAANGMKLNASPDTISAMCAGGVIACVYGWLIEGRKTSPEYVSEQVGLAVESVLSVK